MTDTGGKNDLSVTKEIIKISIPSVFELLFLTMASIIDSKMVSSMGITAISAVSVTNQPSLFLMSIFFAVNIVASSLTARYIGKQDRDGANRIMMTALSASLMFVIVVSILSILFARQIMIICSNQPDTLENSIIYFQIIMGGLIFNVLFLAINAVFRGCGKTNLTFVSNLVSCIVNVVMNYLLIDGHLGFPALKVRGAAIATVLGNAAALCVCVALLLRKSEYINLHYCIKNKIRFSKDILNEMWGMWNKVFPENVLNRVGFLIIGIIASRTGSLAMSVYSVGMLLLNINYAVGTGFQYASVALIGRSLGAGRNDQIKIYSGRIIKYGIISGVVLGILVFAFARPYYSFFGSETEFIRLGQMSCIFIAVICPLQVLQIIMTGILQGLGDMKTTLKIGFVGVTVVNTAVAFIVAILLKGGIYGVWAGSLCCQIVKIALSRKQIKKEIV